MHVAAACCQVLGTKRREPQHTRGATCSNDDPQSQLAKVTKARTERSERVEGERGVRHGALHKHTMVLTP